MRKKKILFLITKGTWGGAQRYVYDLATRIPRDTYCVLVALGGEGQLTDKLRASDVATCHIAALQRDVALCADSRSFLEIYRLMRRERPDVVHLNSSKAAALGALAARLSGAPRIVFTVHGWPFGEQRILVSKAFLWLISWLTALLSHTVICVSDHDAAHARRMPLIARKTVRVWNGIDLNMVFGSGERIRAAFPRGAIITGTIGELNKNKNHIALIEEARKNPDRYVAIVGDGELREALERRIREYGLDARVKLFGFVPAVEALKGFDRFALPSLKEGLPYVALEAKLAGLPIEASRVGGVGEILDNDIANFSLERMMRETCAVYDA